MDKLLLRDESGEREVLLTGPIVVGRDPHCRVHDSSPMLSRRHAESVPSSDGVIARDSGQPERHLRQRRPRRAITLVVRRCRGNRSTEIHVRAGRDAPRGNRSDGDPPDVRSLAPAAGRAGSRAHDQHAGRGRSDARTAGARVCRSRQAGAAGFKWKRPDSACGNCAEPGGRCEARPPYPDGPRVMDGSRDLPDRGTVFVVCPRHRLAPAHVAGPSGSRDGRIESRGICAVARGGRGGGESCDRFHGGRDPRRTPTTRRRHGGTALARRSRDRPFVARQRVVCTHPGARRRAGSRVSTCLRKERRSRRDRAARNRRRRQSRGRCVDDVPARCAAGGRRRRRNHRDRRPRRAWRRAARQHVDFQVDIESHDGT